MPEPKIVHLTKQLPKENWNSLLGEKLSDRFVDTLIDYDCDVYTPEGSLLLKFRRSALNSIATSVAFDVLRKIETKTLNRGTATGKFAVGVPAIRKSGYVSNTVEVPREFAVISNVIGYMDRYTRFPYCRQTAFNAHEPEKFERVVPFLRACSGAYATAAPDRWQIQAQLCAQTKPDWIIPGTVFTTITVNKNWQTAVHTDEGDFKGGLSCITAIRAGEYKGCYLVFPHYRVGVDLRTCDLLMFDSHHMHGNTPLLGRVGEFERVSLVLYYRENMIRCLSAVEELARAKNRKKGDPLW